MDNVSLKVSNLRTHFLTRRGIVKAVDGVDFELRRGECLCLVGESGCGKTVTALSILRLFDSPPGKIVGGQISYDGLDLAKCSLRQLRQIRGKDIAIVFQEAQSALNPVLTIGDQIIEQIKLHLPLDYSMARDRTISLLSEMGIPSAKRVLSYYPHQLSGGMKQRVLIAMSLSCDPQILIADEPTTAVDVTIKAQILDIFHELKASRQLSTIFITHDLAVVAEIGDRAVIMYGGKDVETAPVSEIINNPKHPYTSGLIECLPDVSKTADRLASIPGTTPNPIEMPKGCAFHPRCPKAMKICKQQEPPEIITSKEHKVSCHLYT
ncbi:MAG: ABC transporter ATP-binding protein [Chloroflexi bacterium]|nr:ABC transporter ATP-binding protein [Chloroflexota bacterium]MBL7061763.1 ABC transporter ATP-binding protein [Dehalococcoidia bacterium]